METPDFYTYLVENYGHTLLPELFRVLGPEKFVDFAVMFEGRTVKVTSVKRLFAQWEKVLEGEGDA